MSENDLALREAGARIERSGLHDDVIRADQGEITQRRGRQREAAEDDRPRRERVNAEEREPKKKARQPEIEDQEAPDQGGERDETEDDDDAEDAGSTREGEDESDEGNEDDDSEAGEEGDDADTSEDRDELFTVKVAGQESKVTKDELIRGYQRGADYQRKTTILAQRGRELHAGHVTAVEQTTQYVRHVGAILQGVRNALVGDADSAEMQHLRATNREKWREAREDFGARINQVDNFLSQLGTHHERHTKETQEQFAKNRLATAAEERQVILKSIPDWDDDDATGTPGVKHKVVKYLTDAGFQGQEIDGVSDGRMFVIADKARRYDEYMAKRTQPPKRIAKPAPRVLKNGQTSIAKSGGKVAQQAKGRKDFERAKRDAKQDGSTKAAGRAIERLL